MIYIIGTAVTLNHIEQIPDSGNDIRSVQSAEIIIMHTAGSNHFDRCTVLFLSHDFHHFTAAENPALTDDFQSFIINDGVGTDNNFTRFRIDNRTFRSVSFQTVFPG